ncbi:MAG TPA: hypothetical protein VGI81_09770 [Tepidisphaeraceae bacterium]|jgi:hypothetical protein
MLLGYRRVRRAIEAGQPAAGGNTVIAVTLMVLAIAGALVAYMIATS